MNKTIIFGHRGYPAKFAENSLAGFAYAASHQAEGVEFDVQLTKDGIPVVMHDEKIDRTTDGSGWIKDYTLKEIRDFHLENGEPIPELTEVFKILENKNLFINLEFKTGKVHYTGIVNKVLKLAGHYSFKHPIIYSSFDYVTLKNAQRIDPKQNYCYLINQFASDPTTMLEENHFSAIHPNQFLPSMESAKQRIWVVNDPETAKKYFKKKVAGIFTNDYVLMQKVKKEVV